MFGLAFRVGIATVLGVAAVLKLTRLRAGAASLAGLGIRGGRPAVVARALLELALAAGVAAGFDGAAYAAAALLLLFAAVVALAIRSGRAGLPCPCFGSHGRSPGPPTASTPRGRRTAAGSRSRGRSRATRTSYRPPRGRRGDATDLRTRAGPGARVVAGRPHDRLQLLARRELGRVPLPAWAPDGTLGFWRRTGAGIRLFVRERGRVRPRSAGPGNDYDAAWAPDGGRIAFVSDRSGRPRVYVAFADGTGAAPIASPVGFPSAPAWRPALR